MQSFAFLMFPWAVLALGYTVTIAAKENSIHSDTTFRALWLLAGLIWSLPFFTAFIHWVVADTPLAFGAPPRSRYGPTSVASTAFINVGIGCSLIYASSKVQRNKK